MTGRKSRELTVKSFVQTENGEWVELKSLDMNEQRKHMRRVNLLAAEAIAQARGLQVVVVDE